MARPLRLLRWLLLGALAWQMSTFVAPRTARGTQDVSNPVALHAERPKPMNQEGRQTLAELLAPADQLFEDGVSLGFLVVGLSAFFGEPIVDWTPITAQYLGFLRPSEGINFLPQGAFMCFYGFFGFFVFGPIQWYINIFNIGQGVCEFNKNDGMMYIVRNNEMIREVPLEDFQAVKFEWTNLAVLGARDEIHFMDDPEVYSKFVLEKRAAKLSEFLNVELIVDDA
eukprot:g3794.t1